MKILLAVLVTLSAKPLLAHSGVQMHLHADDPTGLSTILAGLVAGVSCTAVFFAVQWK